MGISIYFLKTRGIATYGSTRTANLTVKFNLKDIR